MSYNLSIDALRPNETIIQGMFIGALHVGSGFWSFNDAPSSDAPFELQENIVSKLNDNTGNIEVYLYVNDQRCFKVYEFEPTPPKQPSLPPGSVYAGDMYVSGCRCQLWKIGFFGTIVQFGVRYNDSAVMYFRLYEEHWPEFGLQMWANWVTTTADPNVFHLPTGPCYKLHSDSPIKRSVEELATQPLSAVPKVLATFRDALQALLVAPPKLHPHFTTQFTAGYGYLTEKNGWKGNNPLWVGTAAANNKTNGYMIEYEEDVAAKVWFHFKSKHIFSPASPGLVTGYGYLKPGRCWASADNVNSPQWPFDIPKGAAYLGKKEVYGRTASLWTWLVSYRNYYGNVTMAVDTSNSAILFLTASGYEQYGAYAMLTSFNPAKPDPKTFQPPQGPCPYIYWGYPH